MLRVAIVDDHQIVLAGFREMLARQPGIEVSFCAASGEEALAALRETPTDVLLLDLALPGKSGLDVLRVARPRHDGLRILVLSGFPEERYAVSMLRHGADGYLCKDCSEDELLQAIRTVAAGRRHGSPRTAQLLAEELADGGASGPPHERLSDRELQVFLHLARGEAVSAIAAELNLSVKTISTYRTRLLEKLAVASNAELATYALQHGLIVP